jgi:type VI secretion system secreted protein Hcp
MRRTIGAALALAACLMVASNSFAIGYAKLGEIKGESTDPAHGDWIDILAWKIIGGSTGQGQRCGSQSPGELVISKLVDSTTPEIFRLLTSCNSLSEVIIDVPIAPETGRSEPGERVMRARFGGVFVKRVESGSPTADDRPTEQITIVYTSVDFEIVEIERED